MNTLKNNLEQREKPELIAIIQYMLHQEPDLEWLLRTPLPTSASRKASIDSQVYRQQVLAAMAAGDHQRRRKRHKVQRRLTAIKSIADAFAEQEDYPAALTIYEVLVREVIEHFNDYRDEYIAFSVMLTGCIDGLDTCFAGEEDNQQTRLRVLRALFAIYRFSTENGMDLDEDIPGLLVGNTTPEERGMMQTGYETRLLIRRDGTAISIQDLARRFRKGEEVICQSVLRKRNLSADLLPVWMPMKQRRQPG